MKIPRRQKLWLALVLLVNVALWLIPSDVVEQIARDRHTMLGRYSRTQFAWMMAAGLLAVVSLYTDLTTGKTYRRRRLQVLAVGLFSIPTLFIADLALRTKERARYVHDTVAYHHQPNVRYRMDLTDKPMAARTYPNAPPGYGKVRCTLSTDKRGYRNRTDLARYDVVVLGDSFAEGSRVSDDDAWPARLAHTSGLSVYNLGMSGYDPLEYAESFRLVGAALKPRWVLCMVYEGNDFRSAKADRKHTAPSLSKRLRKFFKQSPILTSVDRFLIRTFGRMRRDAPVRGGELLDWLPLSIPPGPDAKRYAFAPKQLRDLYESRTEFAVDGHWLNARRHLTTLADLCRQSGAQLAIVFAPVKAHVTLPLASGHLPAEKVRRFAAISYRKSLPERSAFLDTLLKRLDARAQTVRAWCDDQGIPFLDLTGPLRGATEGGVQTYYTYDQHWTPEGHHIAAKATAELLKAFASSSDQADQAGP